MPTYTFEYSSRIDGRVYSAVISAKTEEIARTGLDSRCRHLQTVKIEPHISDEYTGPKYVIERYRLKPDGSPEHISYFDPINYRFGQRINFSEVPLIYTDENKARVDLIELNKLVGPGTVDSNKGIFHRINKLA